jgi:hypothetical protein
MCLVQRVLFAVGSLTKVVPDTGASRTSRHCRMLSVPALPANASRLQAPAFVLHAFAFG